MHWENPDEWVYGGGGYKPTCRYHCKKLCVKAMNQNTRVNTRETKTGEYKRNQHGRGFKLREKHNSINKRVSSRFSRTQQISCTDHVQKPNSIRAWELQTERSAATYTKQKWLGNHTNQPIIQTQPPPNQTDKLCSHYNRPHMHSIF
jgi:hypothetical protein